MSNEESRLSIGELLPAEDVSARFVLALSMARNDLEFALRDAVRAAEDDAQDFTYRVRLLTSHLVEALDSLKAYSGDADVRARMARVPADRRRQLALARGVIQKVGSRALDTIRNSTFHYPSPKSQYSPSSDEQLREAIVSMRDHPAALHLDHRGEHPIVTLSFASDIALALAISNHSSDQSAAREQYVIASEGAVALKAWIESLVLAYFEFKGFEPGAPQIIDAATGPKSAPAELD